MSNFKPDPYKEAFFQEIQNGTKNILLNAVAGSGKTFAIVNGCQFANTKNIAFFAFNKSIAEELKTKVPSHVDCRTLHSLAYKIVMDNQGSFKMDNYKINSLVNEFREDWELNYEEGATCKNLVSLIKIQMCETHEDLIEAAERQALEVTPILIKFAFYIWELAKKDRSTYDFDDLLYFAANDNTYKTPKYDLVFVDECQDLSKIQQKLLFKVLSENGRFIAVGDPYQSIYGFAGADVESFNNLKNQPNTIEMPLFCTYRCARDIVSFAQKIVPHLQAKDDAIQGEVDLDATIEMFQPNDMILCRNTAPIVKLCFKLLGEGKKATVKGQDIGANLISLINKSRAKVWPQLHDYLERHLKEKLIIMQTLYPKLTVEEVKERGGYTTLLDKIEVIKIIRENIQDDSVEEIKSAIKKMFNDKVEGITLSTIHKAKGLEANNVYIVNPNLMPSKYAKLPWQREQEKNLEYVAYTRAKHKLGIVPTKNWDYFNKK